VGADTGHKQDQTVRRKEPKSQDIDLRLLAKLDRPLARRTNQVGWPLSLSRMIGKRTLPGREEKTAMVAGTITDEVRVPQVPKLKVWADFGCRGAWVAQSCKRPTSARVMISRFLGSSPASGSVLTAKSLEPVSDSVSPSLSAPPLLTLCLSLSLSLKQTFKKIF
uniref:Large ribosomal subunit protein uL15/eL18 domain-containing protein n=1 Tax=Suricata suricatta TaxID=37032 RepID=A0A673SX22_SURSU